MTVIFNLLNNCPVTLQDMSMGEKKIFSENTYMLLSQANKKRYDMHTCLKLKLKVVSKII